MSLTPSNMLPLGTIAPNFKLQDTITEKEYTLEQLRGSKGTVILFICNHCPYVIHVNPMLIKIASDYKTKGINFVAISSNDIVNYPQDAPHLMKKNAEQICYNFPYLFDSTQEVAKAYDAACTPDIYLFNEKLALVYRGQLDGSRPENSIPLTGSDLKNALDCLLENKMNTSIQKPSMGCNIKWIK
jgi:thiol-disulfide isomerase/thioredoxin